MIDRANFPTNIHFDAAKAAANFFASHPGVDTVLMTNSISTGRAVPDSDIDMAILVRPSLSDTDLALLEGGWSQTKFESVPIRTYMNSNTRAQVHLDIIRGEYDFEVWDDGGGPDFYEVEIGNHLVYSTPFYDSGPLFSSLRSEFLPYYPETQRLTRLREVIDSVKRDAEFCTAYHARGQHFQAFDRLYKGYQEFLQALFISRKVYPIAYNKWIEEQVVGILGLPDLYVELLELIAIPRVGSKEILKRADRLVGLLEKYVYWAE